MTATIPVPTQDGISAGGPLVVDPSEQFLRGFPSEPQAAPRTVDRGPAPFPRGAPDRLPLWRVQAIWPCRRAPSRRLRFATSSDAGGRLRSFPPRWRSTSHRVSELLIVERPVGGDPCLLPMQASSGSQVWPKPPVTDFSVMSITRSYLPPAICPGAPSVRSLCHDALGSAGGLGSCCRSRRTRTTRTPSGSSSSPLTAILRRSATFAGQRGRLSARDRPARGLGEGRGVSGEYQRRIGPWRRRSRQLRRPLVDGDARRTHEGKPVIHRIWRTRARTRDVSGTVRA